MVGELASGFAVVGAGAWLFGRAQPAAVRGALRVRGLKGFVCPDRGSLSVGELAAVGSSKRAPRASEDASGIVRKPPAAVFEGASGAVSAPPNAGAAGFERGEAASNDREADLERGEAALNGVPPAERQAAAAAWCSAADRPFLTRIDCGAPVSAVSDKVLVAPAAARLVARLLPSRPDSG